MGFRGKGVKNLGLLPPSDVKTNSVFFARKYLIISYLKYLMINCSKADLKIRWGGHLKKCRWGGHPEVVNR